MVLCENGHENEAGATYCKVCHVYIDSTRTPPTPASTRPEVAISPERIALAPGRDAVVTARVSNIGTAPDELIIEAVGGAGAWASVKPWTMVLAPGEGADVSVTVRVPDDPAPPAGMTTFLLRVHSEAHPDEPVTREVAVDVREQSEEEGDVGARAPSVQEEPHPVATPEPADRVSPPPVTEPVPVRPKGGYLATLVGAVLGALVLGIALGLLGLVIGVLSDDGGLGAAFAAIFITLAFAVVGMWLGAVLGAWRSLRARGYAAPKATAGTLALMLPAGVAVMAAAADVLGFLVVPLVILVPPLAARKIVLLFTR